MENNVVYKDDKEYPKLLKGTKGQAPKQLYYKGKYDKNIFQNCLAVVGSRRLTSYGKEAAERIVGEIAMNGITIVSGFMYGGDAVAHSAAIRVGGRTIAVMPCGVDRINPEYQKALYNEILENKGLIISEYKGNMQPFLWTYPQRNRIVAGLSQAVLVLEAGEKSGSLITANLAKKFGRKVFALPGPIGSKLSEGTNWLIKEGAEMVLSSEDILKYFDSGASKDVRHSVSNVSSRHSEPKAKNLSTRSFANAQDDKGKSQDNKGIEQKILEELEIEPLGIDEMARKMSVSAAELGVKLSIMEISGQIKRVGDKYGVKK